MHLFTFTCVNFISVFWLADFHQTWTSKFDWKYQVRQSGVYTIKISKSKSVKVTWSNFDQVNFDSVNRLWEPKSLVGDTYSNFAHNPLFRSRDNDCKIINWRKMIIQNPPNCSRDIELGSQTVAHTRTNKHSESVQIQGQAHTTGYRALPKGRAILLNITNIVVSSCSSSLPYCYLEKKQ